MTEQRTTVLLIRINSAAEVFETTQQVDAVRAAYSGAPLWTLATPQTETLQFLRADQRFDKVLLFPPTPADRKTMFAFRRFMVRQPIRVTVACFGAISGYDYTKHLLSMLFCPGRKMLLNAGGRLFPFFSLRGLWGLVGAVAQTLLGQAAAAAQRHLLPMRPLETRDVRKILWIRLDQIGDVVTSLPALRALKACFPQAQIDAVVRPEVATMLADEPSLNTVLVQGTPQSSAEQLRRRRYDLAVELRGDNASRLLAYQSGARQRLGPRWGLYETPNRPNLSLLMTHLVGVRSSIRHVQESNLDMLHDAGLPVPAVPFELIVMPVRRVAVTQKLEAMGVGTLFAIFHARPSKPAKEWGIAQWAALADTVANDYGLDILLSGAPQDTAYNETILNQAAKGERIKNTAGKFTLAELPALMAQAQIVVSVDTGPMHIAAASGTPVVALMLPWNTATFYPYGQADGLVCPVPGEQAGPGFLSSITVPDVLAVIRHKLTSNDHAHRH